MREDVSIKLTSNYEVKTFIHGSGHSWKHEDINPAMLGINQEVKWTAIIVIMNVSKTIIVNPYIIIHVWTNNYLVHDEGKFE